MAGGLRGENENIKREISSQKGHDMLRTVMIWLLLIVIVGIPTLITIFATNLVFMEEIEKEEMALLDKNAEKETCFRQPQDQEDSKVPARKPMIRDSTR